MKALFAVAALLLGAPAAAQSAPRLQTPDEALAQDAGEYAQRFDVPPDEALRRLRAQAASVAETDRIAVVYADRLAGVAIEHAPAFRIVVLLTGDAPVPDGLAAGVPVTYRTGAPATRGQVVAAIERHQAAIRERLPRPPGLGLDQRTGELVVTIAAADALDRDALRAELAALTAVPVRLRVVDRPDEDAAATVDGGARVAGVNPLDGRRYACTTGFTVTDGARAGVVTAAHCPDALSYLEDGETPLSFVDQWGWGYQDVQLHLADGPLRPAFYADTAKTMLRPVTAARPRSGVRAGEWACHRGERTGYSCAEVELTDFAPGGDLCGGACTPTWVTAAGPRCRSGDSGGPVFTGTTALGLVKGASYAADGRCDFYYWMSTDFLPEGWSVLRDGAPGAETR